MHTNARIHILSQIHDDHRDVASIAIGLSRRWPPEGVSRDRSRQDRGNISSATPVRCPGGVSFSEPCDHGGVAGMALGPPKGEPT
eukprot:2617586-Pyramimonas_sp.AAC.1